MSNDSQPSTILFHTWKYILVQSIVLLGCMFLFSTIVEAQRGKHKARTSSRSTSSQHSSRRLSSSTHTRKRNSIKRTRSTNSTISEPVTTPELLNKAEQDSLLQLQRIKTTTDSIALTPNDAKPKRRDIGNVSLYRWRLLNYTTARIITLQPDTPKDKLQNCFTEADGLIDSTLFDTTRIFTIPRDTVKLLLSSTVYSTRYSAPDTCFFPSHILELRDGEGHIRAQVAFSISCNQFRTFPLDPTLKWTDKKGNRRGDLCRILCLLMSIDSTLTPTIIPPENPEEQPTIIMPLNPQCKPCNK